MPKTPSETIIKRYRHLSLVFLLASGLLFGHPTAYADPPSSDVPISKEVYLRTNNLGFSARFFDLTSGSLVSSLAGKTLYVADRASSSISRYEISESKLVYLSKILIPHKFKSVFILDLHSRDSSNLYVSFVDYSDSIGSCGTTKIGHIKNFQFQSVIYEATPCLSGVGAWSEVGGRMTSDGSSLYVTGGNIFTDLYKNQFPRPGLCCNLPKSFEETWKTSKLYGKILRIDFKTLSADTFAIGFRGPQGLAWDKSRNQLWETEHGPQGGDELNRIYAGKNYGWPFVTYGIPYKPDFVGASGYSKEPRYGKHAGYTEPIFYWSPSIAPSQLIVVEQDSPFYGSFGNDLIISTLKDKSLIKVSLSKIGTVISVERIDIDSRIRDLSSSSAGIVMTTDDGRVIILSPDSKAPLIGPYPPVD